MSDHKLLPEKLHQEHPKYKTPYISIIVCATIVSIMILWTFADLLIIDITLYGAGLFLEFVALIVLRKKMPDANRPFKIKMNIAGLCLMTLIPFSVYLLALAGSFSETGTANAALFAVAALGLAGCGSSENNTVSQNNESVYEQVMGKSVYEPDTSVDAIPVHVRLMFCIAVEEATLTIPDASPVSKKPFPL